jgi:AcrR family transcriptional regulator
MATRAGLSFEKVVDSAVRIADKKGLDNLSLGRVARDVGVKTPSLYEHIRGLPGLQQAIRLRGFQTMASIMTRASVGKSQDDAVRALAYGMRKFVRQHPALYDATVLTAVGDSKEIRDAAEEVMVPLNAVLASYGITGKEAIHAARYLRSLLHGFHSLERAKGFGLNVDVDESYDRLVEMLVQDLKHWMVKGPT